MNKKHICLLLILAVLCSITVTASAVDDGYVTFTSDGDMYEKNFDVDQLFGDLEPGDTRSYTVHIKNEHEKTTRWYMTNEVLSSLEASASGIAGGVYSYVLTYTDPDGKTSTLFDSDSVGGEKKDGKDERTGLKEATEDLEEDFFLDTLNSGEAGRVTLTVSLEGETQGNTYQNTRARIKMNFAVELRDGQTAVKTGDENNLTPYYIGMIAAGLLFLYLALDAYTDRKYKKGRG